jgi:hypothetical protein
MRRSALLFAVAVFAASLGPPPEAGAQSIWWGAGVTFPTGDYSEYARTGYLGVAGLSFPVGLEGLAVIGEGFFGQNSHDLDGDKTYPWGGMAGLLYDLAPADVGGFYFFAQAGVMVHKYSSDTSQGSSDSGLGFGGGAGYGFPLGNTELFLEGRYMQGSFDDGNTGFFGIVGGVALSLGGGP